MAGVDLLHLAQICNPLEHNNFLVKTNRSCPPGNSASSLQFLGAFADQVIFNDALAENHIGTLPVEKVKVRRLEMHFKRRPIIIDFVEKNPVVLRHWRENVEPLAAGFVPARVQGVLINQSAKAHDRSRLQREFHRDHIQIPGSGPLQLNDPVGVENGLDKVRDS